MLDKRPGLKRFGIMVILLIAAALACNAPVVEDSILDTPEASPDVEEPGQPSATVEPATLGAPQTVPASIQTEEAREDGDGPVPTFTPIEQPTLAATLTPSREPTRRPTSTPRPGVTVTTEDAGGPLSFTYSINWRLKDASAKVAIATVNFFVKGGSGDYTYYRDDLEVDGPQFEYEWATCSGNPGSLRVDSSDGQTYREEYFQNPPCPTLTPTP